MLERKGRLSAGGPAEAKGGPRDPGGDVREQQGGLQPDHIGEIGKHATFIKEVEYENDSWQYGDALKQVLEDELRLEGSTDRSEEVLGAKPADGTHGCNE